MLRQCVLTTCFNGSTKLELCTHKKVYWLNKLLEAQILLSTWKLRMAPDKVSTNITSCAVLHYMAIVWKQPMLDDSPIDQLMDEPLAIEEMGHLTANHYRDQFAIDNFDWIYVLK